NVNRACSRRDLRRPIRRRRSWTLGLRMDSASRSSTCRWSGARARPAGDLDERGERRRVAHREIGEDLAVHLDVGGPQPADEPAVAGAVLAAGGVDALDPQRAELTLARPPVAER